MGDELKSAYELAMERLQARDPENADSAPLSAEQKRQIAEVRQRYRTRLAELDVMRKAGESKVSERGDAEKLGKLEEEYEVEKKALEQAMENEVQAIKNGE